MLASSSSSAPLLDHIVMIPHLFCEEGGHSSFDFDMYLFTIHSSEKTIELQKHLITCVKPPAVHGLRECIERYNQENDHILDDQFFLAFIPQENQFYQIKWDLSCVKWFPKEETVNIKAMIFDHIVAWNCVQDKFMLHLI